MKELKKEDRDLCSIVYDLCVSSVSYLDIDPFEPSRLNMQGLLLYRSVEDVKSLVKYLKVVFDEIEIDFERHSFMKIYPEIKNKHVYLCIKKHIEYFEKELDNLNENDVSNQIY